MPQPTCVCFKPWGQDLTAFITPDPHTCPGIVTYGISEADVEIQGHFPKVTQNLHPSGGQHLSCSVLQGSAGGWVGGRLGLGRRYRRGV